MNGQITTARLPADTRNKLLTLSRAKRKTKSEIIRESVDMYYEREEQELDSFTLGEPYFGGYDSTGGQGGGDLSVTYKQRIKEKLRVKYGSD